MVSRGEVWLTRLDPTVGSELQKTRPCVVVSPDLFSHLNVFIVAPMTTGSHATRFRVPVIFQNKSGLILADQLRTVDRSRLLKRVGVVETSVLSDVLTTLRAVFEE